MSDKSENKLHKEFELERVILFSDAVFAIAITLLIIEIKFPERPEDYRVHLDLWKMFKPSLVEFLGFLVSFFIIGMSWAGHLKMFRYLQSYDNGVIFRNLLSLLFIVAFPYAASGLTQFRPSFVFPMLVYILNILLINVSNFLLAHYIFKQKTGLSIAGHEPEKRYIYLHAKTSMIGLAICFTTMLVTAIVRQFR